jgi:hypothetical protein
MMVSTCIYKGMYIRIKCTNFDQFVVLKKYIINLFLKKIENLISQFF